MSKYENASLIQRRDGLLREAEHLEKRLKGIHEKITELNTQILPTLPPAFLKPGDPGFEWPACDQCGSRSLRCGCD